MLAGELLSDLLLIILYFLTLAALTTATYGSLQQGADHSRYVILLSIAIALFSLGSLLVLASNCEEVAFVGFRIQHIGQPFLGGLWFLYTMDVCDYSIRKKYVVASLIVLPFIMSLSVTAGDPLGLFIRSLSYEQGKILPYVTGNFTPLYNVGLLHIYGFSIVSGILIICKVVNPSEKSRLRLLVHSCAGLLPLVVGIASIVTNNYYKREAVSASLGISSVILNMYLLKSGAFRIVAKAKYQLFESIQDGIVIVNTHNEYMDANDRAKSIFPILAETKSGTSITDIKGFWSFFKKIEKRGYKFTVKNDNTSKHYTITRSELLEDQQHIGTTFMIYDITELEELTVKLQELATTDELTQVNNRRNFFSLAEGMITTMKRLKTDVCVAMMDIDHFKQINDTYGHPFGDKVLKFVADHCKTLLRQSDVLGRYGGEEFVIVFYGMDLDSVIRRLNYLRQSISKIEICQDEIKANVTVSIGFSFVDYEAVHPLKHAISRADFALYQAKEGGRNKVCGIS